MIIRTFSLFFCILFFLCTDGFSQIRSSVNFPYSRFGVGDIHPHNSVRGLGMSGTGLATPDPEFINMENPALLSRAQQTEHVVKRNETMHGIARSYFITEEDLRDKNPDISGEIEEGDVLIIPVKKYSMWDASIGGVYGSTATEGSSQRSGSVFFNYFAYSFPISHKNTLSIGITPYSQVSYQSVISTTIEDTGEPLQLFDEGNGGLYRVYLSDGYDISNNLSVGLEAAYVFGNIWNENFLMLLDEDIQEKVGNVITTRYSGLHLKPGAFYRTNVAGSGSEDNNDPLFLNLAVTADLYPYMYQDLSRSLQTRTPYDGILMDSVISGQQSSVSFPTSLNFGLALQRPGEFTYGLDLSFTNWSSYDGYTSGELTNSYTVSAGGEWNIGNNSANDRDWLARAGLKYRMTPYVVNGNQLQEFSFSVGGSIPLVKTHPIRYRQMPFNKLDLAVEVGQRGTTNNNLVREQFIRAYLGIIINDVWFERRKLD